MIKVLKKKDNKKMAKKGKIKFKPKQVAKKLLGTLSPRAKDVIKKRFGLEDERRMTLESIGEIYGITRERVRQIENFALGTIKKSDAYEEVAHVMEELLNHMAEHGLLVHEGDFLSEVAGDEGLQNHVYFFLNLGGDKFKRMKEDEEFHNRWTSDVVLAEGIHEALRKLHKELSADDVVSEDEILDLFKKYAKEHVDKDFDDEVMLRWLIISKLVGKNPLGDWGAAHSPNIKIRGMRDLAYLVLRENGSPMHFTEVSNAIMKSFGRRAHVATCHNELIKDERFVLVGRGLYALTSWGYTRGTVRDVIAEILRKEGPLTRVEIVARVLKERYVKDNTIGVNLQNSKQFKRDDKGRYMV